MFSVSRILVIAVIAISGVAGASSASSTSTSTGTAAAVTATSTKPATSASHAPAPSASRKPNAAVPVSKAAPALIIGGVMFAAPTVPPPVPRSTLLDLYAYRLGAVWPESLALGPRRVPFKHYNLRGVAPYTYEYWVRAVEGELFGIYFTGRNQFPEQEELSIQAKVVHGKDSVDGAILLAQYRAMKPWPGAIYNQPVDEDMASPLQFGRSELTTKIVNEWKEDATDDPPNTIRVVLEWGRARRSSKLRQFTSQSNMATLGKPKHCLSDLYTFRKYKELDAYTFIFRYAPQEWLEAHGKCTHEVLEPGPNYKVVFEQLELEESKKEEQAVEEMVTVS